MFCMALSGSFFTKLCFWKAFRRVARTAFAAMHGKSKPFRWRCFSCSRKKGLFWHKMEWNTTSASLASWWWLIRLSLRQSKILQVLLQVVLHVMHMAAYGNPTSSSIWLHSLLHAPHAIYPSWTGRKYCACVVHYIKSNFNMHISGTETNTTSANHASCGSAYIWCLFIWIKENSATYSDRISQTDKLKNSVHS